LLVNSLQDDDDNNNNNNNKVFYIFLISEYISLVQNYARCYAICKSGGSRL